MNSILGSSRYFLLTDDDHKDFYSLVLACGHQRQMHLSRIRNSQSCLSDRRSCAVHMTISCEDAEFDSCFCFCMMTFCVKY